ncbi:PQQ-binding-like beta-propeller repeat protein [Haloplanus litoreus]|uniref:PQQ-binding-like beta-propeller repeat protein n=1 Tax=Haloplanus litoreus TaxID=767515 RepID=A0ABD5ZYH9_9EURY
MTPPRTPSERRSLSGSVSRRTTLQSVGVVLTGVGAERWSFTDENSTVYEPAVTDGWVSAGSNDDRVYAFSRDGELQWRVETNSVAGTVVAGDGRLYVATNERLFAIDRI